MERLERNQLFFRLRDEYGIVNGVSIDWLLQVAFPLAKIENTEAISSYFDKYHKLLEDFEKETTDLEFEKHMTTLDRDKAKKEIRKKYITAYKKLTGGSKAVKELNDAYLFFKRLSDEHSAYASFVKGNGNVFKFIATTISTIMENINAGNYDIGETMEQFFTSHTLDEFGDRVPNYFELQSKSSSILRLALDRAYKRHGLVSSSDSYDLNMALRKEAKERKVEIGDDPATAYDAIRYELFKEARDEVEREQFKEQRIRELMDKGEL